MAEVASTSDWFLRNFMSDFKAMMCILGSVVLVMCVIFYGFLFYIYPEATPVFVPGVPAKS